MKTNKIFKRLLIFAIAALMMLSAVSMVSAATGDDCSDPIVVNIPADLDYNDLGQTTCGRGNNYDDTDLGNYDGGEDIIYELVVTTDTEVKVTVTSATSWIGVGLFDDCPDVGSLIASDTGYGEPWTFTALLTTGTYYLMVDTWPTPDCIPDFDLTISLPAPPTPGDDCTDPIFVNIPGDLDYEDLDQYTCGRGDNYFDTDLGYYDGGEDIIYQLDVTTDTTCVFTMDPKGTTYTGFGLFSDCPGFNGLIWETYDWSDGSVPLSFSYTLLASESPYYVMVDTWPSPDCIPDFDLSIVELFDFEEDIGVSEIIKPEASDDFVAITPEVIVSDYMGVGTLDGEVTIEIKEGSSGSGSGGSGSGGLNWDFEDDDGGWIPTADWDPVGDWEWTNTYDVSNYVGSYNPPPTAYSGTGLWGTIIYGDHTNSGGFSYLSKTVDLSGLASPMLTFYSWNEAFGSWDYGQVEVNGDVVWGPDHGDPTDWELVEIPLDSYGGLSDVEITFAFYATTVVNRAGWYIDDVAITDTALRATVYTDTVTGVNVPAGGSTTVTFAPWTPDETGYYTVVACATTPLDNTPGNDCQTKNVIIGTIDAGVSDVLMPDVLMGPVTFKPKVAVTNYGDIDGLAVPVHCAIDDYGTSNVVFEEDFEEVNIGLSHASAKITTSINRETPSALDEPSIVGSSEIYWDGVTGLQRNEGYWTVVDTDGDGVSWHQTDNRYFSAGASMYNGNEDTYQYEPNSDDMLVSPRIHVGATGTFEFKIWLDIEGGTYDQFYFGSSADGSSFTWFWLGATPPYGGWYTVSVPVTDIDANGNTHVGFLFESDGSVQYEGVYIDDVVVYGESIFSEHQIVNVDAGETIEVEFGNFTPPAKSFYELHACTQHYYDENPANDCDTLLFSTDAPVYILETGFGYNTIQAGIDAAEEGQTVVATDGTYEEDILINKAIIVTGENPPTESSTIHGTVTITADGATFMNFIVHPLEVFDSHDAAVMIAASDVMVVDNIIRNVRGLVGETSFSIKGIHVYAGSGPGYSNIVIQNNIVEDVLNENVSESGGGPSGFVDVGYDGGLTSYYTPCYGFYNYGWSATIYQASELSSIPVGSDITAIRYYIANTPSSYVMNDQRIYLAETTLTGFNSGDPRPDETTMTQVYGGNIVWDGTGGFDIDFDTPFTYSGGNLMVYYENWDGVYSSGYPTFVAYSSEPTYYSMYRYSDPYNPHDPGIGTGFTPYNYATPMTGFHFEEDDSGGGTITYGGATGIMIQGNVSDIYVLDNTITDVHSAGWCYGVELTQTNIPPEYPAPQRVFVEGNYFARIGNDPEAYNAAYPGVMVTIEGGMNASLVKVRYNIFDPDCSTPAYALINKDTQNILDATNNFFGYPNGPGGDVADSVNGEIAEGYGAHIIDAGPVHFAPWIGLKSMADAEPLVVQTGKPVVFDGSESWMNKYVYSPPALIGDDVIYHETFDTVPPAGWTKTDPMPEAGDSSDIYVDDTWDDPVVYFYWSGLNDGDFIASDAGTLPSGQTLRFTSFIDYYTSSFNAVVTVNGDDVTPWSNPVTGNIAKNTYDVDISGYTDPIVRFEFQGDPWNINGWVVDDVMIIGEAGPDEPEWDDSFVYPGLTTPQHYLWNFDDGMYSSKAKPTHVYNAPGTYNVNLRIQGDNFHPYWSNMMFDWEYLTIQAYGSGAPLSANADGGNLGGYETIVGETVQLFGSGSGGTPPYSYQWDLGNGETRTEQNPVGAFKESGTYQVTLTVIDSEFNTATDTAEVVVQGIDQLYASIQVPQHASTGDLVAFSSMVNGGVRPYTYTWNFGDGTNSVSANPQHVYTQEGTYTVTLTVTDANNDEIVRSSTIEVQGVEEHEGVEIKQVKGGLMVSATIAAGDSNVDWSISVDGRVFLGGEASGTIPAGAQNTVRLPFTVGFGPVDVTITANDVVESYSAFALGPLFLNLQ